MYTVPIRDVTNTPILLSKKRSRSASTYGSSKWVLGFKITMAHCFTIEKGSASGIVTSICSFPAILVPSFRILTLGAVRKCLLHCSGRSHIVLKRSTLNSLVSSLQSEWSFMVSPISANMSRFFQNSVDSARSLCARRLFMVLSLRRRVAKVAENAMGKHEPMPPTLRSVA